MLIRFYNFSKKRNSTAQPGETAYNPNCVLKDSCSLLHPVIMITRGADFNPASYNYCYIQDFGRYYFINDWTFENGALYAHCDVDPLASWKTEIGASTQYVLRSSDEYNGYLTDNLYPVTSESVFYERTSSNLWNTADNGCFIVGILANSGQNTIPGGVNYYGFSIGDYTEFMNVVFGLTPASGANGPFANTLKSRFNMTDAEAMAAAYVAENPYTDYIDSIVWFPFSVSIFGPRLSGGLYMGGNLLASVHYRLVDPKFNQVYSAVFSAVQKHPQAATRGQYLNAAPYSVYQMYLPRVGLINIDSSYLISYDKLSVSIQVDPVTGQGQYRIYIGNDDDSVKHLIYTDFIPLGVTVKIGVTKEVGTSKQATISTVAAAASLNPFAVAESIISMQRESQAPGSGRIGESGGFLGLTGSESSTYGFITLQSVHYLVATEDNTDNGRPLCSPRQISRVPGYIVCQHGDISLPATDTELNMIKAFMEGGFYYE